MATFIKLDLILIDLEWSSLRKALLAVAEATKLTMAT